MGIFDWFRAKKEVPQMKKVKFDEVNGAILEKKKEMRDSEKAILNKINDRVKLLIGEFQSELNAINQVNLDNRKAETKLKLIVKNNLDEYALCLRKLKANLESMKAERVQELIKKINFNFHEFKTKSHMNFEKATFLVGKELEAVMESIKRFHEELNKLLEKDKELLGNFGIIEKIEILMIQISQIDKIKKEISAEISKYEEETNELVKEIEDSREKIKKITGSEKYKETAGKKQEIETRKQKLKKEIANLSEMIDLKELAKIYHSNEKEMKIINKYRENFNYAFEEDNGELLLELVKAEEKEKIQEEISRIINEKKEISSIKIDGDEILEIKSEINKIENKIVEIKVENMKREKKISQLDEKAGSIREILASELARVRFELV